MVQRRLRVLQIGRWVLVRFGFVRLRIVRLRVEEQQFGQLARESSRRVTAVLLDGQALATETLTQVAERVRRCTEAGVSPCLAVVLVGDDPASKVYVGAKGKRAAQVGITTRDFRPSAAEATTASLLGLVAELNADPSVHGILIQLPLPAHVDAAAILAAVEPAKDVDGFHPFNLGLLVAGAPRFVACTPQGCMLLLERSGMDLAGAHAVVVGRSTIVGKPMAHLLLGAHATVTMAHSRTRDLAAEVGRADVVVAAVGRTELIRGEWIKPGAVVIDVGINRGADGKLRGDVEFAAAQARARAITPVPGGVGPMTIACLMQNVVLAAERRVDLAPS